MSCKCRIRKLLSFEKPLHVVLFNVKLVCAEEEKILDCISPGSLGGPRRSLSPDQAGP